jgi:hypothetical protein
VAGEVRGRHDPAAQLDTFGQRWRFVNQPEVADVRTPMRALLPLLPVAICVSCASTSPVSTATPAAATSTTQAHVSTAVPLADLAPRVGDGSIAVLPVFFVPRDGTLPDLEKSTRHLRTHLDLARAHYQSLLGTTFAIADEPIGVYRSPNPNAYFFDVVADSAEDRAHRMLRELLAWRGLDRYTANVVFVAIYVSTGVPIGGGGRTINGPPGSGGGYLEMDHASLVTDQPYRFQSTLVHELGHAFGLTHVDCHGHDLHANGSLMSYNPAHWSRGLERSPTPGDLNAEDRYALALNRRVFPELAPPTAHVDLAALQRCFLGPMSAGPLRDLPGVGYELYFEGARVNGPDAALYSRALAEANCAENIRRYPNTRVECRYNGATFDVR